ncbi:uncharacterized protein LOC135333017 isoform X2 [Halichondria panicea]|uniref:uncharacterized protein LOC135333017 isoform X2 n=1 Tax=Halichondria panicea TaxID=6063 RepID=UPI00312B2E8B
MSISSLENSPIQGIRGTGSVSDCDQETHSPVSVCSSDHAPQSDRPERMREWIIRMINSGRFPGLEWINKEKDIFRVPWIHAKKRGYDRKRDAAIFREWAIHSGKYREDGDPTTWKINFRCAINGLKDIMEIKDMQQEDCRVYKVLPSRGRMRRRRPISVRHEPYPASCTAPTYPGIPDGAHHYFPMPSTTAHPSPLMNPSYQTNIKLEPFDSTMIPYQPISRSGTVFSSCAHEPSMFYSYTGHIPEHLNMGEASYPDLQSHMQEQKFHPLLPPPSTILTNKTSDVIPLCRHDSPDSGIGTDPRSSPLMSHSSPQHSPAAVMSQGQNSPIQQHSPLLSQQNSPLQSQPSPVMSSCSIGVPSPASVVSSTPLIDDGNEVAQFFDELESNPSSSPLPSTPPPPSNEVNIRVFYGSIPIHSENVDCTNGCKIFANGDLSRSDDDMISNCFGPTSAHTICLPDSHAHPAAKQVFGAMKRGFLIESRDGNIYVTPLCRTMVYCGNSSSDPAVSLEKEKCSKVFDYNACFRPALDHYAFNPGKSPNPYFILSLGQTWGPGRHVTENLVSIVVTHSRAKHEIEAIGLTHLLTKDLLIDMPDTVDIDTATETDLEAEAFFKRCQNM